jgi:hypothetical protein
MNLKAVPPTLLMILSFVVVSGAMADSYRCGRKVVRDGDPVSYLLKICGEPRFKDSGSSMIEVEGVRRKTRVQRWYYKKSSRSLEHIVLIHGGKIAAIEVGGR